MRVRACRDTDRQHKRFSFFLESVKKKALFYPSCCLKIFTLSTINKKRRRLILCTSLFCIWNSKREKKFCTLNYSYNKLKRFLIEFSSGEIFFKLSIYYFFFSCLIQSLKTVEKLQHYDIKGGTLLRILIVNPKQITQKRFMSVLCAYICSMNSREINVT